MIIGLISPHIFSIDGTPSPNIGDEIIYTYLSRELKSMFPLSEQYNFPLHDSLNRYHKSILDRCEFIFVTGSNFLTPRFDSQRKAILSLDSLGLKNRIILMGGGWSNILNSGLDRKTLLLYSRLMSKDSIHSVRDSFTLDKLSVVSNNIVNTSCPTMWSLSETEYCRRNFTEDCLFTLTDYNIHTVNDSDFIELLLKNFKTLHFFPQGRHDSLYLKSLDIFKKNDHRFNFLQRKLNSLNELISQKSISYVGTRLHCGIHTLNHSIDSLILEVDNRARFISNDTNLPVIKRGDIKSMISWLNGEKLFNKFALPKNWNKWKESYKV